MMERVESPSELILEKCESPEGEEEYVLSRNGSRKKCTSYKAFLHQHRGGFKPVLRLIKKNGKPNVFNSQVQTLWDRYVRDLGNTLVDSHWHWTVICLSSCFILSWVIFATIWMIISNVNGDNDLEHPTDTPCLSGIFGFGGYVMFSIETQQTIGYGSRYINRHCPEGTFIMCLQLILGSAICGAMVSIVNAKMVRPFQRYSKNLFSNNAVIGIRDGCLCLIFRVRDEESGRYAIGTSINAYLVQVKPGEPHLKTLDLEPFGLLIWPLEIVHKITHSSPFYDLSAKELITKRFEIVVSMQGTSQATGQTSKTRTSYLSTEILWGSKFKKCISYKYDQNSYFVDHENFHLTEEIVTPLCSAQRLAEVFNDMRSYPNNINNNSLSDSDSVNSTYDNLNETFNLVNENQDVRIDHNREFDQLLESLQRTILSERQELDKD